MPMRRFFFAKLAAVLVRLNLLTKPMYIYNADETGFSKVHKQSFSSTWTKNSLGHHFR